MFVICGSLVGVFIKFYKGVDTLLVNVWRNEIGIIYLTPLALWEIILNRDMLGEFPFQRGLIQICINGLLSALANFSFTQAASMTELSHALTLKNLCGIVLLIIDIFTRKRTSVFTKKGAIIISVGALLLYFGNWSFDQTTNFFWGNIWGLISLVCWTLLLLNTNQLLMLLPPCFIICVQAYLALGFTFLVYLI